MLLHLGRIYLNLLSFGCWDKMCLPFLIFSSFKIYLLLILNQYSKFRMKAKITAVAEFLNKFEYLIVFTLCNFLIVLFWRIDSQFNTIIAKTKKKSLITFDLFVSYCTKPMIAKTLNDLPLIQEGLCRTSTQPFLQKYLAYSHFRNIITKYDTYLHKNWIYYSTHL